MDICNSRVFCKLTNTFSLQAHSSGPANGDVKKEEDDKTVTAGLVNGVVKKEVDGVAPSVEYVPEPLEVKDPALEAFSDVFARFQFPVDEESVRICSSV